jgi:hypothetical protein
LVLNKTKTNILSDSVEFKEVVEIEGIRKVAEYKYLGVRLSLDKKKMIRDAKMDI